VLLTFKEAGGGLDPPWTAVKIRLEGDTDRTDTTAAAADPYTEAGELFHALPVDHVEGKVVRVVCLLVSDLLPEEVERNAILPEFCGPKIAIQ
jgi:hypothetical protein